MKKSVRVVAVSLAACSSIVVAGCSKDSSGAAGDASASAAPAADSAPTAQAMTGQGMDGRPRMERGDGGATMGGGDFDGRHDERGGEHERH